ncbi:hypothetical protein AMECASPLE_030359 [Ameca splendens]|uniref:Uncharacterized protein n=1 Tax=Ameca splendens TaxID=208324 RepID=A0ABV0YH46_9TELE
MQNEYTKKENYVREIAGFSKAWLSLPRCLPHYKCQPILYPRLQSLLTVPPPYAVWCCKSAKLPCGIYTMPKSRHLLLYCPYKQHLLLAVVENVLTSVSPLFHPDSCCDL